MYGDYMKKILSLLAIVSLGIMMTSCNENKSVGTIKIVAPSGAPALSQVKIAHDALDDNYRISGYDVSFDVVSGPQAIQAALTSQSHDIVIAPINLGATLYKSNQAYQYAANVTGGNLYFASTVAISSVSDFSNKNLVFFGENTINQAVIDRILSTYQIDTTSVSFLASTSDTMQQLVADANPNTIYLVAEPVLSAARTKLMSMSKTLYTIDVQQEFKNVTGFDFLQAGVFVKKDLDKKAINSYLLELEKSITFVNENPTDAAAYAKELELGLPEPAILTNAIPGCNLRYLSSDAAKASFEALVNLAPKYFGGALPVDDFYFKK